MLQRISGRSIAAFLIMLGFCFSLVLVMVLNNNQVEQIRMEQLIAEKSNRINTVMLRLLLRTQIVASNIQHSGGEVEDFARLASTLMDDPAIRNILIAPDGVVSDIYPVEGNEALLELNFFYRDTVLGNVPYETRLLTAIAKETRELVVGGPFDAIQGGQILVGRLAVFLKDENGNENFWGIVGITLDYSKVLNGVGLNDLSIIGFDYEIWRVNPDTRERQIIMDSDHNQPSNTSYIEMPISILNAEWYFRILASNSWYNFPIAWIAMIIGILMSILVAAVVQNAHELKILKDQMEKLSNADPLTGIHNRRYFMDTVPRQMERVTRSGGESYIIIMDLDYFKSINDRYGHSSGDMVLKEFCLRVAGTLRPHDIFARYGGEEFILFVSEISQESVLKLAERIRLSISETEIEMVNTSTVVTVSLGVAPAAPNNKLEDAISYADESLYQAKSENRNKVVFYGLAEVV